MDVDYLARLVVQPLQRANTDPGHMPGAAGNAHLSKPVKFDDSARDASGRTWPTRPQRARVPPSRAGRGTGMPPASLP